MTNFDLHSPGGRLKYIITMLNLTDHEFGMSIGRSKSIVSRLVNNKMQISKKLLYNIKLKYPTINTNWIQHNTGSSGIGEEVRARRELYYINIISNLEAEIERLKIENQQLKQPK